MKLFRFPLLSLTLLFTILTTITAQERKVLIIGVDGTRSDALQQANTPNIDGLLDSSLYTFNAWHVGITFSGPSWSTILTGVRFNKHGVKDNGFAGSNFSQYKPFPALAKQVLPNLKIVEVAEWGPLINDVTYGDWDDQVKTADGDVTATADSAIIQLQDTTLDAIFVYFDTVDITGHAGGFLPTNSNYIDAIEHVDVAVGRILTALHNRPSYANEDWLILLVTDHGGTLIGHGLNSNEERRIWWIASGSAVNHREVSAADPGTYNCRFNTTFQYSYDSTCVDEALMAQSPVQADIAVTALHHLLYNTGVDPQTRVDWDLDGKSWLKVDDTTGIGPTPQKEALAVFPNPTSGQFTVKYDGNSLATDIAVFDLLGRKIEVPVNSLSNNRVKLDLNSQPPGTYIVRMNLNDRVLTTRVVLSE